MKRCKQVRFTAKLSLPNLQIIYDFLDPVYGSRDLFRALLFLRRRDDSVQRYHAVVGIHVNARQVRQLVYRQFRLDGSRHSRIVDILTVGRDGIFTSIDESHRVAGEVAVE